MNISLTRVSDASQLELYSQNPIQLHERNASRRKAFVNTRHHEPSHANTPQRTSRLIRVHGVSLKPKDQLP